MIRRSRIVHRQGERAFVAAAPAAKRGIELLTRAEQANVDHRFVLASGVVELDRKRAHALRHIEGHQAIRLMIAVANLAA
jgi:hypothetical protein